MNGKSCKNQRSYIQVLRLQKNKIQQIKIKTKSPNQHAKVVDLQLVQAVDKAPGFVQVVMVANFLGPGLDVFQKGKGFLPGMLEDGAFMQFSEQIDIRGKAVFPVVHRV